LPEHIPIVLPKVDYLIIRKYHKNFFRTVEKDGLVPYEIIIKELGNYFNEFNYLSIPDLRILKQQNADKMADKFNSLKIVSSVGDFGTGVGKDGFVNVQPG